MVGDERDLEVFSIRPAVVAQLQARARTRVWPAVSLPAKILEGLREGNTSGTIRIQCLEGHR